MSGILVFAAGVMDEGKPAAGDDHPGRGVGSGRWSFRPYPRVLLPDSHARVLSRRDNDADAKDADSSFDYLLHHHRSERQGVME